MAVNVGFSEADWQRIEHDWSAWWAGELDRPMVVVEGVRSGMEIEPREAPAFTTNLPMDMPAEEVVERYARRSERVFYAGDAWPRWFPNFGPGIMAGFVGSVVKTVPDTVWFEPVEEADISELRIRHDDTNSWYRRIKELTETAVREWGDGIQVSLTDLGGNLDVLASLRGTEQLLTDLCDRPEEVERLVREITCLWVRYYDELYGIIETAGRGSSPWAPVWAADKTYMLQCDFAYMISPAMFERFVLRDLQACCEHLDHGFYHLDGKGQIPHLDMLLSLERLRGVQWVPGDGAPPAEEWLDILKRIRDAGKLCQLYVSSAGARKIVRELGGRGFAFCILGALTEQEATALVDVLRKEDIGLRG